MKLVKHTIIPFDYPACFNEWSNMIQKEIDANRGLKIAEKEDLIMDALIEEVYVLLTFNN